MLDHLEVGVHRLNDGVEVLPRVGVLLSRVGVRKEGKVRRKVLEVLGVVRQLGGQVLENNYYFKTETYKESVGVICHLNYPPHIPKEIH